MATTRSEEAGEPSRRTATSAPKFALRKPRAVWVVQGAALLAASYGLPRDSWGQSWRIEPSAKATVTATSNSGFANAASSGRDLILDVAPRVSLTGRGASYTLRGYIEGDSLTYARSTQSNQFIPSAQLTLNANAVDRWFYVDAGAGITQSAVDPYSVVSNGSLPSERLQTTQYRLSPYLDHAFTPSTNLYLRNDNTWTRRTGEVASVERLGNYEKISNAALFTIKPEPLGLSLEGNQERTEYVNASSSTLELASARAVLSYAVDPTLTLGVVGGTEQSEFRQIKSRDSIRGFRLRWLPTERSDLNVSVERRFFDNGWNVSWSHRSPFMAMNVNLVRQPSSQPSTYLLPNTGGDLRSLIDAAFTTRYPNPTERAVVVDTAVANLGANSATATAVEVFSDYAQLQNRASASVAFLSPRSVLTVSAYALKSEQLVRADAPPPVGALPPADNKQVGVSASFNRRLTSTLTLEAGAGAAKTTGLAAAAGDSTTSTSARLTASQGLNPKTRVFVGGRVQHAKLILFDTATSIETSSSVKEIAGFLGIEHKF